MTKNEADIIGKTLQSLRDFTDDIVIVDNGSTDQTMAVSRSFNCHIIETIWQGYGPTKNIGIDAAKHDWILSLDADEVPDEKLLKSISGIDFDKTDKAYDLNFKTYFGEKHIKFGEWGIDHHIRLFNRTLIRWSNDEVHEQLIIPANVSIEKLTGAVHHYTIKNAVELKEKFIKYAALNAKKYHGNKRSSVIKMWGSPAFSFIKNYLFKLGFLDGNEGFTIAKLSAYYTWLKYYRLKQLNKNK
jgi:(heptosyl)LPS beta-1,4-glucosyltransferase